MKYAVTSAGKTIDAGIDSRFGRCAYIVTYETETRTLEVFPNPFRENEEEAGPALIGLLSEKGVQKVVSHSFGIKIKELMDSKQIQMIIPHNKDMTVASMINLLERRR